MAYVAMVVVVEADSLAAAYEGVVQSIAGTDDVKFVGAPWVVQPLGKEDLGAPPDPADELFGTLECVDQHPER
jgi:hypothetical protein